ncbi:hypothetical protein [Streptomyces sp. NPDC051662]|uniref:hypothetical protein n=1 Tax=Streptomyces sp. NPDC051662 TaxID=3154750 RepID=UPI0034276599
MPAGSGMAGAAYLPLALTSSPDHLARQTRQTRHSGVRVIVTDVLNTPRTERTGAIGGVTEIRAKGETG